MPFAALLRGMLDPRLKALEPRPVEFSGLLAVMREQWLSAPPLDDRFGEKSYAIISDKYMNFSSRVGYHFSVLDAYCGATINKNYITFAFKGGRRTRSAASAGSGPSPASSPPWTLLWRSPPTGWTPAWPNMTVG